MGSFRSLPNGGLLLSIIDLSRERLSAGSKAAVSLPLLREILMVAVSALPFDEEFYTTMYPDIRTAYDSGEISDLRTHFIEQGYFEGRLGSDPKVDEEFYSKTYLDVAAAIRKGGVISALEHYARAGASEGRFASMEDQELVTHWLGVKERV